MYSFGSKSKKCYLWYDTPYLQTKPNLYECRKVQRSQIFKQNLNISICSSFYWIFSRAVALLFNWKYFWGWNLVQTTWGQCVDDVWMTREWSMHVVHMGQQLCIKPTGLLVTDLGVKKLQMATNMFIMINMWVCVCTCMHAHMCAHMCGGCNQHPQTKGDHQNQ